MKILITGQPRSGKTTLLEKFIELIPNKQGFVGREIRIDGERVGFELVSSDGAIATLSSVDSKSRIRVSRYGVEVEQLDDFLKKLPVVQVNNILYVDEIGQMQLVSDRFKQTINDYLNADNLYVGTITSVYKDDFIDQVLSRSDIVLLQIDQDNREQIHNIMKGLARNIDLLQKLDLNIKNELTKMARDYVQSNRLIQLRKLFNNTIKYLAQNRVEKIGAHSFRIEGNMNKHNVRIINHDWVCDCDLFRGEGGFIGNAGECSHIQSAKILESVA